MATTYTTNLKLALPATGEISGIWGDTVNDNITKMIEEALTGVASLSTWVANAMTITTTNGTTSSGRCALLDLSGTLSATGTLTLPTANKQYIIRNRTTGGYAVTVGMAAGATVSVPNGETVGVFTDGTDTKVIITQITKSLSVKSNATTGLTQFTGPAAGTTRVLTVPDADATVLTTNAAVTVAQGGTGATTLTLNNVLLGNGTSAPQFVAPSTSGNVLMSNGTTWSSTAISGLTVSQGGTGASTLTANGVLIGNGTSAVTATAPGTSGNVLMSNGTSWASTAISGLTVAQGGTGASTFTSKSLLMGNGTGAIDEVPIGAGDEVLYVDGTTWGTVGVHALLSPRTDTNGTTSGDITPNSTDKDMYLITGLTGTIVMKKPTSSAAQGTKFMIRIKDDGTSRTITSWEIGVSGGYRAFTGVTLPTATTAGKTTYVGCVYNDTDSRWDVVAVVTEA